jgi:myosin-5
LDTAAKLLQLDSKVLSSALTHREVRVRGQEKTFANLDCNGASDSRHALCKFVYGRMFDWLVERINASMAKTSGKAATQQGQYIGILDIFGFEIFKHNSFEQLCINFTNEMLQQHFNNNTFKLEEEIYNNEGIKWDSIDFIDNQPMIELITKKRIGILPLLDEELKVPGGSDVKFLNKLIDKQKPGKDKDKHTVMVGTRVRNAFCVRHFAGKVTYDVTGFLDKNRDTLTEDLVDMLRSSQHSFLQLLYPADESVSTGQRKASLSKQFQKQLKNLMAQLYATEPHYIRKLYKRTCFEGEVV